MLMKNTGKDCSEKVYGGDLKCTELAVMQRYVHMT
jgi:hypothetical protein